jgi:hypothetical protein
MFLQPSAAPFAWKRDAWTVLPLPLGAAAGATIAAPLMAPAVSGYCGTEDAKRRGELMSEQQTTDPKTYRSGADEPEDAKPEGIVPRELVDEPASPPSDEQEMRPDALGNIASEPAAEQVPRDAGDDADATNIGGPDDTRGSWAGEKANPDHGRTGQTDEA